MVKAIAQISPQLFQTLQWRLWLFQLLLWALLLPAYSSWSLAVFALLLLAKLWQLYRGGPPWSLTKNNLLAAAMVMALLISARQLGVMHLMFHFLLLAAVLRLLGLSDRRPADISQLLWVHYFLLACAFILHQDLWLAVLIFTALLLNLHCHHLCFCREKPQWQWRQMSRVAALMSVATVLLFVLFPRLPPLWQLPGAKLNQTGLSDNLAPGAVASLLQSNALAFRVRFDSTAPPAETRYFRAKIYDVFDGRAWRAQRPQLNTTSAPVERPQYRYTVIVEPHQQFSLFALGLPHQHSGNVAVNREALVVAEQPLSQRISYQLSSSMQPLPVRGDVTRYLQLPAGNAKARQLALELKRQAPAAKALATRIGMYFQQQQFRYSLSPGEINGEQIDNFLFEKKLGFCSHYASTTVFLLRAAGVPARLVGGYLGGEWQDDGAYLQVLQKDAHAWVEYYQDDRWWTFDPTALIEPALLRELSGSAASSEFSGLAGDWMRQRLEIWLMQPLRNMDYYWSMWVLSFDATEQQGLFGQFNNWRQQIKLQVHHAWWLLMLPGLWLAFWWWHRPRLQPVEQLFQPMLHLQDKLPQQSYQQYLQEWAGKHPALMPEISACLDGYLRWQFNGEPGGLIQARQMMRQLKPKLKRLRS
ncbi:MAG: DUF3488 and transglutaminase-like domain-containing protein [Rheinheimera sp.]|nr:DUF3488 and transglutaminase-like domain-containing protein [Rheinheimera sp.]